MIIDKEKTIKKAIARYNYLFPVRGKQSINDCFFSLRGEIFLIFRTKNNKVHTFRAEMARPSVLSSSSNREALDTIFKALNKPIIVRSFITKKPVRACLINLFPVPGITWSSNTVAHSDTFCAARLAHSSTNSSTVQPDGSSRTVPAASLSEVTIRQNGFTAGDRYTFSDPDCYIIRDTAMCQYEILAKGYLPICQFTDMLPTPREALQGDATTFHYEVLAPGCLNRRPRPEWKTISNRCVSGYVHERPVQLVNRDSVTTPEITRQVSYVNSHQMAR